MTEGLKKEPYSSINDEEESQDESRDKLSKYSNIEEVEVNLLLKLYK